ncbi:MAG: RNA-binding protein [Deltaproteobacteria bacterium]|nr:RNA-binding protein [Deltaproteobacteria bacterium]
MNIYIGRLSFEVTEDDLREAFGSFGEVVSAKVIKDEYNGKSKGFGFVEMPARIEAEKAIRELNNSELKGKSIMVNQANPQRGGNRGNGGKRGSFNRRRF